jgi:hypothetical protein
MENYLAWFFGDFIEVSARAKETGKNLAAVNFRPTKERLLT